MQPRTTLILLLVAAALGAFVYFYEIRGGEARKQAEEHAKRLFPDVELDAVQAVGFRTSDGQQVRLERADEGWRIVSPLSFPADEIAAEGLARGLAEIASEGVIDEPQAPSVYGLDDEDRVVHFRAGDRDYTLRVGERTPVGGNTYAAVGEAEQGPVYTVASYRVSGFQKSLKELRESRVLLFDEAALARVELAWPGGGVTLEREPPGDWRLVAPLEGEADASTVETLLSDLRFLRADEFLDEPGPSDREALAVKAFEAVLETRAEEGAEPERFRLVVGASVDGGRVVQGAERNVLYRIPAERLEDFPRRVVAYRFKELARFPAIDAEKVEIAFRTQAADSAQQVVVHAARGEDGWTSEPERVAPGKLSRLVSELSQLEAEDILADAMGPQERAGLGLAPPRTVLRVWGPEPEGGGQRPVLAEVHLGDADAERGIPAQRPDREAVYQLDYALAEHVPIHLEAFRNRFVSAEEAEAAADPDASDATDEDELGEPAPDA